MKIVPAVAVAMLFVGSGFWAGRSTGKPQVPVSSLQDQIVGPWKLESRVNKKPDGSVTPLPGWDEAPGYITYDRTGFMSVQFMQLSRTKENGASGYTAYFGPYTVDQSTGTVTHHIMCDLNTDDPRCHHARQES